MGGCMREPELPLRIGTNVWIGSEPLYLARDLKYLDRGVVQLVEYPSASEVSRAFRNQAIDGMVISLDELFVLAVDGLQPKIVVVADVSFGADVVVGHSACGRCGSQRQAVAVESGALRTCLEPSVGDQWNAGERRQHGAPGIERASRRLQTRSSRRRCDFGLSYPDARQALTRSSTAQIPGEIVDLLAVRSAIEKNPRAAQALLTAWFKALDYLEREPKDAAARLAVREQITGEHSCRR
jgi:NitT/TauT family transport system substrate-binding protein